MADGVHTLALNESNRILAARSVLWVRILLDIGSMQVARRMLYVLLRGMRFTKRKGLAIAICYLRFFLGASRMTGNAGCKPKSSTTSIATAPSPRRCCTTSRWTAKSDAPLATATLLSVCISSSSVSGTLTLYPPSFSANNLVLLKQSRAEEKENSK